MVFFFFFLFVLNKYSETSIKLQGYFGQVNTLVPVDLVERRTLSRNDLQIAKQVCNLLLL